jgi:hypothetical protein
MPATVVYDATGEAGSACSRVGQGALELNSVATSTAATGADVRGEAGPIHCNRVVGIYEKCG